MIFSIVSIPHQGSIKLSSQFLCPRSSLIFDSLKFYNELYEFWKRVLKRFQGGTLSKLTAVHRGSEITLLVHPARNPLPCSSNGVWSNNGSHSRATGHTRLRSSNEKGRAGEVRTFSVFWASFFLITCSFLFSGFPWRVHDPFSSFWIEAVLKSTQMYYKTPKSW